VPGIELDGYFLCAKPDSIQGDLYQENLLCWTFALQATALHHVQYAPLHKPYPSVAVDMVVQI